MLRSWSRWGWSTGEGEGCDNSVCSLHSASRTWLEALKPLLGPHPLDFRSSEENPSVLHAGLCVRRYLLVP